MSAKIVRRDQFVGSGPVRYKLETGEHGLQTATVTVDYTDAPVPPHYYVADYYEVANRDPRVLFTFGKIDYPNENKLRNKLEIDFPALYFIAQFWKSRESFQNTLRAFVKQFDYEPTKPGTISVPVDKVQTIHSNNALMVLSGGECMIDFFYLSPRDMALKAPRAQDVSLESLVRVIMGPNLLLGLLDSCEPIAEKLLPKYGAPHEVEHETVES